MTSAPRSSHPFVVYLAKEERGHQNPRSSVSRCTASSSSTAPSVLARSNLDNVCTAPSLTSCSAATIADIEIDTVLRHKPSTIHLARPMRKFVNYFKVEIPRTDNYMNMIDETRPEQQAAWLERDGKHLTNAHKIANRDVQHPPTVMLASGNLFINQISRLGECWLLILPRR